MQTGPCAAAATGSHQAPSLHAVAASHRPALRLLASQPGDQMAAAGAVGDRGKHSGQPAAPHAFRCCTGGGACLLLLPCLLLTQPAPAASCCRHVSIVVCGPKSSGKSTTCGRLLYELGLLPEHELEKLKVRRQAAAAAAQAAAAGNSSEAGSRQQQRAATGGSHRSSALAVRRHARAAATMAGEGW